MGGGSYRNTLTYLGQLSGAELASGTAFSRPDSAIFAPGMGNRVNLFVRDQISEASVDVPTLNDYGLLISWNFRGLIIGQDEAQPTRTDDTPNTIAFDPIVQPWQSQILSVDQSLVEADLSRIHIDSNFYRFPKNKSFLPGEAQGNRIIPMTAHGDFMTVYFYSDEEAGFPGYALSDRLTLWGCFGEDAVGSCGDGLGGVSQQALGGQVLGVEQIAFDDGAGNPETLTNVVQWGDWLDTGRANAIELLVEKTTANVPDDVYIAVQYSRDDGTTVYVPTQIDAVAGGDVYRSGSEQRITDFTAAEDNRLLLIEDVSPQASVRFGAYYAGAAGAPDLLIRARMLLVTS